MKKRILLGSAAVLIILALAITSTILIMRDKFNRGENQETTTTTTTTSNSTTSATSSEKPEPSPSPAATPSPTPEPPTPTPQEGLPQIYSDMAKAFLVDPTTDPAYALSDDQRFDAIDFTKRYFRPTYTSKVTLFASTQAVKPALLPAQGSAGNIGSGSPASLMFSGESVYTNAPFAVQIPDKGSQIVWLAFENHAANAAKIILQIGSAPFPGGSPDYANAPGLITSSEFDPSTKEASIGFNWLRFIEQNMKTPSFQKPIASPWSWFNLSAANSHQRIYYFRAFPVNASGVCIGDPGNGLPVISGRPVSKIISSRSTADKFSLLAASKSGLPQYTENPTVFIENSVVYILVNNDIDKRIYHFLPAGYPTATTSLVMQVATTDFTESVYNWENPAGLVFERRIYKGEAEFDKLQLPTPSVGIDFTPFSPQMAQLGGKQIAYYVRFVALAPGGSPGTVSPKLSKTVKVQIGSPTSSQTLFLPKVEVDAGLPVIDKISYQPIEWEWGDWPYRYVVFRQPTYAEVFPLTGSSKPFPDYPVGKELYFSPYVEDESILEEVMAAIDSFFSNMTSFFSKIVNWVSSTYDNLKNGLVEFIVSRFPVEFLREELEFVLRGMLDYGLMTIGIPPSLPTFDDLTSMGTEYLATLALQQAGIPADELTVNGLVELEEAIRDNLKSSNDTPSPNPMGWNFIKHDPDKMYKPACILVTVSNPTGKISPPGWISVDSDRYVPTRPTNPDQQNFYSKFGNLSHYNLYKPVRGIQVPSLAPGQRLVIPIYLEENINVPYFTGGAIITRSDFKTLYKQFGQHTFSVSIYHELPTADQFAKNQGLAPNAIYSYKNTGDSKTFNTEPYVKYEWP